MAYAIRIFSECEKKKEFWQDPDFGPTKDDEHGSLSIYYTGETPRGHAEVDEITWARPATYLADDNDDEEEEENPEKGKKKDTECHFLIGDGGSNEVVQGQMGNCWFISALSVLADRDEFIRGGGDEVDLDNSRMVDNEAAINCSIGVYPPLFHKFRHWGIYVLRFFKDFKWRYVVIDD